VRSLKNALEAGGTAYPGIIDEIDKVRTINEELNAENKGLNQELELMRNSRETTKPCAECAHWKSHTSSLATKYFEALKSLKVELKTLKETTKEELKTGRRELKAELSGKLVEALKTLEQKKPKRNQSMKSIGRRSTGSYVSNKDLRASAERPRSTSLKKSN
jgi:hypothetical protein